MVIRTRPLDSKEFDESQPRDEGGKWTSAGGDGSGAGGPLPPPPPPPATLTTEDRAAAREAVSHVPKTPGRADGSGTLDDPIAVGDDLDRAVREIYAGNHIRLDQPTQVSTLVDKLGDYAQEATEKGEQAPTYDLGKVSVAGTNLFTQESLGIPRVQMPQLAGTPTPGSKADAYPKDKSGDVNLGDAFRDAMENEGFKVTAERVDPATLRATQMDLVGPKVAGMSKAVEGGTLRSRDIFVTRDNYVIDGHHQWAATVLANLREGNERFDIGVQRVDTDIGTALDAANEFVTAMGIPPKAGVAKTIEAVKRLMAWMADVEAQNAPAPERKEEPAMPSETGLKTRWQKHREQMARDAELEDRVRRYRLSLFE